MSDTSAPSAAADGADHRMPTIRDIAERAGVATSTVSRALSNPQRVNARTREIGVRKAVGATNAEIRAQFLTEAVLISLSGGIVGIIVGLALPYSVRFITDYHLPISGWSIIIAVLVSSAVGILFGTAPAARAAHFDPIESLRYE